MNTGIPNNLDEAIAQVRTLIGEHGQEKAKKMLEVDFVADAHHILGRHLRNEWGLWKGSALRDWFIKEGIQHPDDMSGIILTSFHRQLAGKDRDLQGQVKYYQEYWKAQKQEEPMHD